MENLPNNVRGMVAQLEGKELRRSQNLNMLMTLGSTQQKDRPVFEFLKIFSDEIKGNKIISFSLLLKV